MGSQRWEKADTEYCRTILQDIPIIVILSKCDVAEEHQMKAIEDIIKQSKLENVKEVIRIAAKPMPRDDVSPKLCPQGHDDITYRPKTKQLQCHTCESISTFDPTPQSINMQVLLQTTHKILPEICRKSFIAAQIVSFNSKKLVCIGMIVAAALSAYAVGWSPIPWSDSITLAGIQVGLIALLAGQYGLVNSVPIPATVGVAVVTGIGLGVTSSLKLLIGPGTIIAGAIDSTIAIVLTAGVGAAYLMLFDTIAKRIAIADVSERPSIIKEIIDKFDIVAAVKTIVKVLWKNISITNPKGCIEKAIQIAIDKNDST